LGAAADSKGAQDVDWPQFLGPHRNDVVEGTKLASQWPAGGPRLVWKIDCGVGFSSPVIANGVLVLMERNGENGPEEITRGIDPKTGREIWKTSIPCTWHAREYTFGPVSTPVIAKDRVVCLGIGGKLRCQALTTGKVFWEKDLVRDIIGNWRNWGFICSPLVVGNRVILAVCVQAWGKGLVAWELSDGKEAWSTPYFQSYGGSPGVMTVAGKPVVVASAEAGIRGAGNLVGFDAGDGKIVWSASLPGNSNCNIPTPLFVADLGMVFVGINGDGPTFGVKLPPSGQGKAEVAWQDPDHVAYFSNYLYYGGLLFGHGYKAHGSPPKFYCLDPKTGTTLWDQNTKDEQRCLLGSDGKVIELHDNGDLVLSDANARGGYRQLSRAKVIDKTWCYPAFCQGKLFIRSNTRLICLDLTGK
jgi:outer membrane protein assembly factor BamB